MSRRIAAVLALGVVMTATAAVALSVLLEPTHPALPPVIEIQPAAQDGREARSAPERGKRRRARRGDGAVPRQPAGAPARRAGTPGVGTAPARRGRPRSPAPEPPSPPRLPPAGTPLPPADDDADDVGED